jgi:hypothetical protein
LGAAATQRLGGGPYVHIPAGQDIQGLGQQGGEVVVLPGKAPVVKQKKDVCEPKTIKK